MRWGQVLSFATSPPEFDEFNILLEQIVHEGGEVHALGIGQGRELSLHLLVQVDRQIDLHARLVKLPALAA